MVDVAPRRGVPVRWRAYSLSIKNAGHAVSEEYRPMMEVAQGALRIVEAVWADHGDGPIGDLYTEVGTRFVVQQDRSREALAAALDACGLDARYLAAADDEKWDAEIRWSMDEAIGVVGDDVGVPILLFRDGDDAAGIFGPVISTVPTGDEALALWDHVVALTRSPTFYELKRSRTSPPQL